MPVLGKISQKKVILPSSVEGDEAWVTINTDLTVGDVVGLDKGNSEESTFLMLERIIQDWNFTEADGVTKAQVTRENIKKMTVADMLKIQSEINIPKDALDDLKKKGLSLS